MDTPNERLARELAVAAKANGAPVVLVDHEVIAWLAKQTGSTVKPALLHRWWATAGLHVSAERMKAAGSMGKVAATFPIDGKSWTDLKEHHTIPTDLEAM